MTTYNTGNAVGSGDPRDLFDNSEIVDVWATNREKESHPDRLGVPRKTWHGMEQGYQRFLLESGYHLIEEEYGPDIEITALNQVLYVGGEFWRLKSPDLVPYTTTGAGMPEGGAFVSAGDAVLRGDMADAAVSTKGAALVGYRGQSVRQALDSRVISVSSVADLLSLDTDNLVDGQQIKLLSYHEPLFPSVKFFGGGLLYWDASSTEAADGGVVFGELAQGRFKRDIDVFGPINIHWFGAIPDYVDESNKGSDNYEAIQSCYNYAAGRAVWAPAGQYSIGKTVIVPKGTLTTGDGVYSRWLNFAAGTVFRPMGAGNPQIWTDIAEGDDPAIRPLFVCGGQAVKFEYCSFVDQSTDPWDVAVFVAASRQCSLFECVIFGEWDNAGLYLDATWSDNNTYLLGLHPEVEPQSMCEFNATNCYLGGKTSYKLQGTTRSTDGYDTSTFMWSRNGASDIAFVGCQFRPSGGAGHACVWQDAAAINSANAAQGQWFQNCAYRGGNAEFTLWLDRCNRTYFHGYSENFTAGAKVRITSRTGLVNLAGRFFSAGTVYVGDTSQGYTLDPNLNRLTNVMVHDELGRQNLRVLTGPQDLELVAGSRDVIAKCDRFINLQHQGVNKFQVTSVRNTTYQRLSPADDNQYNLGETDRRFGTAFLGSDPVVTSDGREKEIHLIPDDVLDAWGDVDYIAYKWLGAIEEKGDAARMHVGVVAQSIKDAFENRGLNAFDWGLLCYDEWDEQDEIIDSWDAEYGEAGEVIVEAGSQVVQEYRPAGNRYSIRPAECHFLEAAYQRRRMKRIECRLDQLESEV